MNNFKQRVRCANCGMIYEAYTHLDNMGLMPTDDKCPKCGSNAKDPMQCVPQKYIKTNTADWKSSEEKK